MKVLIFLIYLLVVVLSMVVFETAAVAASSSNTTTTTSEYCFAFDYTLQIENSSQTTTTMGSVLVQVRQQGLDYLNQTFGASLSGIHVMNWTTESLVLADEVSSLANKYCQQARTTTTSSFENQECGLVSSKLCVKAPAWLYSRHVETFSYSKLQMFFAAAVAAARSSDAVAVPVVVYQGPMEIKTRLQLELQGARRYMTEREKRGLLDLFMKLWFLFPQTLFSIKTMTIVLEQQQQANNNPGGTTRHRRQQRQLILSPPKFAQQRVSNRPSLHTTTTRQLQFNFQDFAVRGGGTSANIPDTIPADSTPDTSNIPDTIPTIEELPPFFPSLGDGNDEEAIAMMNTIEVVLVAQCQGGNTDCTQENLEEMIRDQAGNYVGADGSILLDQLQKDVQANAAAYFDDIFKIVLGQVGSTSGNGGSVVAFDLNITALLEGARTKIPPLSEQQTPVEQSATPSWVWILIFAIFGFLAWGFLLAWQFASCRKIYQRRLLLWQQQQQQLHKNDVKSPQKDQDVATATTSRKSSGLSSPGGGGGANAPGVVVFDNDDNEQPSSMMPLSVDGNHSKDGQETEKENKGPTIVDVDDEEIEIVSKQQGVGKF